MKKIDKMSDRELRNELRDTRRLLAEAACPTCGGVEEWRRRGYSEEMIAKYQAGCPWCADRLELLD